MSIIDNRSPPDWLAELLERSETQIADGQTVPLEPVLDRLRTSIARMKAKQQQPVPKTARKA